ncbi:MAG: hypothetical protein OHK0046_13880 [Anaerolineae bacterium]
MRRRGDLLTALASTLVISLGGIIVAGLLFSTDLGVPENLVNILNATSDTLLRLATITIALTILIGIANLVLVHGRRIRERQKGFIYSFILLFSFILAISTYVLDRDNSLVLLETVQIAIESSLAGLLLFALVFGAARMLRRRVTWSGMLFIVTLLIILIGAIPLSNAGALRDVREWLLDIPVSAGARGILLGIALATLITGIRILIGVDRSYRE